MNKPNSLVAPIVGLGLDILACLRNRPFVPHSLTKLRNILYCREVTGADTVVEIGSYKGVTTRRLARRFRQVISVEIVPELHYKAQETCKNYSNVELLLGDGKDILPWISSRVKRAILFLDGHYSGGETGQGDEPEPVLSELDAVHPNLENFVAIVIDDFRLFGVEQGWPSKSEVFAKLEECLPNSDWQHAVLNDQFIIIRKQ